MDTELLCKFGENQIVNGASIVFTSSIIVILTISRDIIQSCMGGSWLVCKKLLWISSYFISLIEKQSQLKTVSRSQAIVYGRTPDTTPCRALMDI